MQRAVDAHVSPRVRHRYTQVLIELMVAREGVLPLEQHVASLQEYLKLRAEALLNMIIKYAKDIADAYWVCKTDTLSNAQDTDSQVRLLITVASPRLAKVVLLEAQASCSKRVLDAVKQTCKTVACVRRRVVARRSQYLSRA